MAKKEEQRLKGQNNVGFFCFTTEVKSLYLHTPLAGISTLEPKAFFSEEAVILALPVTVQNQARKHELSHISDVCFPLIDLNI